MRNLNNELVISCDKVLSVDYSRFLVFATNRYCGFEHQYIFLEKEKENYEKRLKHIMKCMIDFGKECNQVEPLFDSASPILVVVLDGLYYVVDGQHRLMAAKKLNIPFWYQIIPEITTKETAESYFRRFNSLQKKWDKLDDLASAARSGDENAIAILMACNKFSLPVNVVIYFADRSGHKIESHNKKHNYDANIINILCELDLKMAFLATNCDVNEALKLAKNRDFHHAIFHIYKKYNKFQIEKMVSHITKKPCGILKNTTSSMPYLLAFGIGNV